MNGWFAAIAHQTIIAARIIAARARAISFDGRFGIAGGDAIIAAGIITTGARPIAQDRLLGKGTRHSRKADEAGEGDDAHFISPDLCGDSDPANRIIQAAILWE